MLPVPRWQCRDLRWFWSPCATGTARGWRWCSAITPQGGVCPYYAGDLCDHCDIGAGEGAAFDRAMNSRRLAWFAEYYQSHLPEVRHLVLYNSGSVLNPREMPLELLDEILVFARSLPDVSVVSLDSREAYIRPVSLRRDVFGYGRRGS